MKYIKTYNQFILEENKFILKAKFLIDKSGLVHKSDGQVFKYNITSDDDTGYVGAIGEDSILYTNSADFQKLFNVILPSTNIQTHLFIKKSGKVIQDVGGSIKNNKIVDSKGKSYVACIGDDMKMYSKNSEIDKIYKFVDSVWHPGKIINTEPVD